MNPYALAVVIVVASYFIGAISPATLVARTRGIDLHDAGSGNPGATNAGRSMGRKVGVLIGVADIVKGFLPAAIASMVWGLQFGMIAGLAAVLGHITSPFLRFRGGKGVATGIGAILGTQPVWAVPVLLVFVITYVLTKRVGVSSVAGSLTLIPVSLLAWNSGSPGYVVVFGTLLAVLIVGRHRQNLVEAFGSGRH